MITIAEHRKIEDNLIRTLDEEGLRRRINYDTSRFVPSLVNLIRYEFNPNPEEARDGYYSYYRIGAEWLDQTQSEALIIVPKMGNIDFIEMFMTCLQDNETSDEFSSIYDIDFESKPIRSKALSSILSPLLIVQFLTVVRKIASRGLRKDYIHRTENLSRVKGRINLRTTEQLAIKGHREKVNCSYDEYSVDTAENRFIKRALRISVDIISLMQEHRSYPKLSSMCNHCLSAFENVTDDASSKSIVVKGNKLYKEYAIANHLAQMIVRRRDVAVDSTHTLDYDIVPVFRIDMALLFEHYTLAQLRKVFGQSSILYQTAGYRNRFFPDFIIRNDEFKVIVDAKYIDPESNVVSKPEYIKQLSAYCRDTDILRKMGYDPNDIDSIPIIPCVLAHPSVKAKNISKPTLFSHLVPHTLKFYTLAIRIPTV